MRTRPRAIPLTFRRYSSFSLKWTYISSLAFFEIGSVICAAATGSEMVRERPTFELTAPVHRGSGHRRSALSRCSRSDGLQLGFAGGYVGAYLLSGLVD